MPKVREIVAILNSNDSSEYYLATVSKVGELDIEVEYFGTYGGAWSSIRFQPLRVVLTGKSKGMYTLTKRNSKQVTGSMDIGTWEETVFLRNLDLTKDGHLNADSRRRLEQTSFELASIPGLN